MSPNLLYYNQEYRYLIKETLKHNLQSSDQVIDHKKNERMKKNNQGYSKWNYNELKRLDNSGKICIKIPRNYSQQ